MGKTDIGVIFDCDGTLLDSMGAWRELEADLASRAGMVLTQEETDALCAMTIGECAAFFHGSFGLGKAASEVEDMINGFMADFYTNRAVARHGAAEFVEALALRDVPMAVASSTPSALLRAGIASAGLLPYMRAVISVDDVGKTKRDPEVYDAARAALGTKRALTWGFDDALYAVRALKAFGYRTCGIYDCDLSGTRAALIREADLFADSFAALDVDDFLAFAQESTQGSVQK